MHKATSSTATVASTYASHTPFPASAQTNGMVAAGVVVGAIVETDCARVSSGESAPRRKPYPAACASFSAIFSSNVFSGAPPADREFSMPYHSGPAKPTQHFLHTNSGIQL